MLKWKGRALSTGCACCIEPLAATGVSRRQLLADGGENRMIDGVVHERRRHLADRSLAALPEQQPVGHERIALQHLLLRFGQRR